MKQFFTAFTQAFVLVVGILLIVPSFATAEVVPWRGTFCNAQTELCIQIDAGYEADNKGIWRFDAAFITKEGNATCYTDAIYENGQSRTAGHRFYSFALSEDNTELTLSQGPNKEKEEEYGCTFTEHFGTYINKCPETTSAPKDVTITVKKVFESYHVTFMEYTDQEGEHSIRVSYQDREMYEKLIGKTVPMRFVMEQYFDEHDGDCVQRAKVLMIDGITLP